MPDVLSQVLADPAVTMVFGAVGATVVALWVAAAWWAYTDAARRTDSTVASLVAAAWVVVSTPFLLPFSLAVYALARPQQTAVEGRTRRLARDLVAIGEASAIGGCGTCGEPVDPTWLRCPACSDWLAAPCAGCGQWSERSLAVCPWCAAEERAVPAVPTPSARGVGASPGRSRRSRRKLRAVGPGMVAGSRQAHHGRITPAPEARPAALRSR